MKWALQLIITLLFTALIALLVYAAVKYLSPIWRPIVLYGYLTLGAIIASAGAARIFRQLRQTSDIKTELLSSIYKAQAVINHVAYIRRIVASICSLLEEVLVWPVGFVRGILLSRTLSTVSGRD